VCLCNRLFTGKPLDGPATNEGNTKLQDGSDALVDWAKFASLRAELGANFVRILGYFREDGEKSVTKIEEAMHARDSAALVIPAHTMKSEARQFGAEPLAALAEEIEFAGRRGVEQRLFPDQILPQVARLRPLYQQTIGLLDQETNPLVARRPAFGRRPANQEFGRI
jgi:histidine phosphotransfer protein HptB